TPADYIIRLRTRHAADLLKNRNIRIFEIASASGFHDSNYFSRIFRKHYGRSPLGFRTGI
ncbi:MAG: helix-turn-helix domain-containing protein, partial [Victivallales bacterium]